MKILYVTTVSNTVNAFLIPHIEMLVNSGHRVDVAFAIDQGVDPKIYEMGCKVFEIPFQRSPFKANNVLAYKMIKKVIVEGDYKIIHTHTPVASTIVRLASKNIQDVKVIYTAHGFHFYKGAPIINWLFYYPIEKILSKYTDVLITINKEDYERARKSFKTNQIDYLPGVGIDLKKINNTVVDKTVKRDELNIPSDAFVILSVGELNKNKNHKLVIKALAKINNPKVYYVICGEGVLKDYLISLGTELNVINQIKLLGYRSDILEIYKISEIFVFPSFREGLPVSLMEAMASGLSIVASNVRGNTDLVMNEINGYCCNPYDVECFANAIQYLFKNEDVSFDFSAYNSNIAHSYDVNKILARMMGIYSYLYDNSLNNWSDF